MTSTLTNVKIFKVLHWLVLMSYTYVKAPLPFRISDMATVSYKGNVILIGGVNEKGQTVNTVVMYD